MSQTLDKITALFISSDGKKLSPTAYAFLVLLCLAFFLPGLASIPPTDRDESLFAQASKQMIETGNYTDIRVQNEPRYKKPIGIYWLQSASVRALSPNQLNEIWAYRVPSLIGATLAVLMTAALGALLFTPNVGLFAAIMLASCIILNVEARLAKTDAALLACITAAMFALAKAYLGQGTRLKTPFIFWTAIAAGILIKGPLIFLPVFGVLVWLKFGTKNIGWLRDLRPLPGLIYALILVAPWFIAIIMQSHGAFLSQSAGHDMMAKLWQGQNRGTIPFGAHLMALPILFFPASLFFLLALPDIWKNRRDAAYRFCLGWIVPAWFVFEFSLTKLPHYTLPMYPALALLSAHGLANGYPRLTANPKSRFPLVLLVAIWIIVGGSLAFVTTLFPKIADKSLLLPQALAAGALLIAQTAALVVFFKSKPGSLGLLTLGSLLFLGTTFGYTLPNLQHIWMSRQISDAVETIRASTACSKMHVISVGYREPSLPFMEGTDTLLAKTETEAADALKQTTCGIAVVGKKQKKAFLESFALDTQKLREETTLEGFNIGHGAPALLTLYTQPPVSP